MTGGSSEGAQQGLVHKKREIKQLGLQVAALSAKVQEKEKEREALKDDISMVEEKLRITRQKLHDTEIRVGELWQRPAARRRREPRNRGTNCAEGDGR